MSKRKCPQCKNIKTFPGNRKVCESCRSFNHDLSTGKILGPDFADITTEGFKEPMQKVDGGFGYYGAITRTKTGSHIQCHMCGFFFRNLSAHVSHKHKMPGREYRLQHGIRLTEGLLSPMERQRAQKRYNMNARVNRQHLLEITVKANKALREKISKGELKPGGDQWSPQTRNLKGMCRDQTLAKIRHLAQLNDGVALWRDFMELYGQGQESVIKHWFGTWDNAVREAGYPTHRERITERRGELVLDMIDRIRLFWEKNGRTPQSSDFNSNNSLPTQHQIKRAFGGMNKARRAAGVPVLVCRGNGVWEEACDE